jgi:predicted transcriptional regulator
VQQTEVQQSLLGRFIDATFKGNATALVMQALGNHDASSEELAQIKALIEKMEKGS